MKSKILNLLLITTSLFGYLEWGKNNHIFLVEAEIEIFSKLVTHPTSVLHPFTILPIMGQFLLLYTLFQKETSTLLTYFGMACLGILFLLMFFIGCISLNYKILIATLPFLVVALITIRNSRKK